MTFDVEDFTSDISISVLRSILEFLRNRKLKATFFVTGHMAEKLGKFPDVLGLMRDHEIGYHSSSHSVRPTLFEFTDIDDYEEAYSTSLERETSHINPLNGKIEGRGGIHSLRDLFPTKAIEAYRSPGWCWSPPHIEALRDLGIRFDFSTVLSRTPVNYKGLTFYSYPALSHWTGSEYDYRLLLLSLVRNRFPVIDLHPSQLVNRNDWDMIYWNGNPERIAAPPQRSTQEIEVLLDRLSQFLKWLAHLQKTKVLGVTADLKETDKKPVIDIESVKRWYEVSAQWSQQKFHYRPRFLRQHFFRFFELATSRPVEDKDYRDRKHPTPSRLARALFFASLQEKSYRN